MVDAPLFTESDLFEISRLVKKQFGIALGPQKRFLVKTRLQKYIYSLGFKSFKDYLQYVENDKTGRELAALADRISTNHTYFNRESAHFDFLWQTVIPYWAARKSASEKIRIWSAGCSSGEEAYQIAMILNEYFGLNKVTDQAAILATDISRRALKKAELGQFSKNNVIHLKKEWVQKYFMQVNEQVFVVKPFLKSLILFRRLNLVRERFPFKRKFHVIFCRNVMIYFDEPMREKLIFRFRRYLQPGGFLFLGHSESLSHRDPYFKYVQPSVYVRREQT